MNSETTFTTTSGNFCQFETTTDEDGTPSAIVVWMLGQPTEDDLKEFHQFVVNQTSRDISFTLLGSIQKDQLPEAQAIVKERLKESQ
jgi:hypothetical protein